MTTWKPTAAEITAILRWLADLLTATEAHSDWPNPAACKYPLDAVVGKEPV